MVMMEVEVIAWLIESKPVSMKEVMGEVRLNAFLNEAKGGALPAAKCQGWFITALAFRTNSALRLTASFLIILSSFHAPLPAVVLHFLPIYSRAIVASFVAILICDLHKLHAIRN